MNILYPYINIYMFFIFTYILSMHQNVTVSIHALRNLMDRAVLVKRKKEKKKVAHFRHPSYQHIKLVKLLKHVVFSWDTKSGIWSEGGGDRDRGPSGVHFHFLCVRACFHALQFFFHCFLFSFCCVMSGAC